MLIQRLVEFADAKNLADDPYFEKKPIPWLLSVDASGRFLGLLTTASESKKRGNDEYPIPKKVGNAAAVATFAVQNPRFVLGYSAASEPQAKLDRDFGAFREMVQTAASRHPASAGMQAALAFYADAEQVAAARAAAAAQNVKDGERIAVAFSGDNNIPLFATAEGRQFWRDYRQASEAKTDKKAGEVLCLGCGTVSEPVQTADTRPQVPGGQPAGSALISFDKTAFQSFGWDKNANAPLCRKCSDGYTRALVHLLDRGNRSRIDQAGTAFVFWTSLGSGSEYIDLLEDPDSEQARKILLAANTGQAPGASPPDARLFALGVRGNGGRIVVADWFDMTLPQAHANLGSWFEDLQVRLPFDEREKGVVHRTAGQLSRPPRLWTLCRATAREDKEVNPRTPTAIVRAAIRGDALPLSVAEACIRRLPLDGFGDFFAPARIGLIRCTLNRRARATGGKERELQTGLDLDNGDPAYLCGRLLATLEAVQWFAVGDVGANIIDRYYGKASTAPAVAFGPLMTLAQSHLGAIKNAGTRTNLEKELTEIVGQLEAAFPKTLTLEGQGRFAIGFYHQKAHRFEEMRRRREERAALASDDDSTEETGE